MINRSSGRRLATTAFVAVIALAPTACGSKSSSTSEGKDPSVSTSEPQTSADKDSAAGKPTVDVPSGPAPTTLQQTDLKVGTGAEAKTGDNVNVQYVGVSYSTKKQFDASWDRGQPFTFKLGQGNVIKGWDQGVVGMKVGGRRQLVIPPDLGYGTQGSPPVIGPNETLVFVVDLVSIG